MALFISRLTKYVEMKQSRAVRNSSVGVERPWDLLPCLLLVKKKLQSCRDVAYNQLSGVLYMGS